MKGLARRRRGEPCESCDVMQERAGLLARGLAACVQLLERERDQRSMPLPRLLAILHHRLDHLMSETNGRTKR